MKKEELLPYESDASQIKGRAKQIFFPRTIKEIKG